MDIILFSLYNNSVRGNIISLIMLYVRKLTISMPGHNEQKLFIIVVITTIVSSSTHLFLPFHLSPLLHISFFYQRTLETSKLMAGYESY